MVKREIIDRPVAEDTRRTKIKTAEKRPSLNSSSNSLTKKTYLAITGAALGKAACVKLGGG